MSADRPINADVPPAGRQMEEPSAPSQPERPSAPRQPRRRRRRAQVPLTLKLLAGIVVLAIAFIVAAVVGGSGGAGNSTSVQGPAPRPAREPTAPEAPAPQTAETLGYPSFATDNTTRVGGADAASNAAAVALAVFPSTTASQRPAAVTLVGEDDWAGAIAAAVLMSAPVRAPVLFSNEDDLPDATAEALEALDPRGDASTDGTSLFVVGEVALPGGSPKTSRVDFGDPASTAAQIATLRDRLFGSPPAHVVVAPSSRPDLAMPAAAWAARSGDPVLFSGAAKLPQPTVAALERHPNVPVYVLGPSPAISSDVIREIAKIDPRVKRVSGKDAVANALAFARYRDGGFGWNLNDPGHGFVLARSNAPLDAAAAAPLSASGTWGPLLLSDDAATLPAELRSYFLDVKPGYTTNPTRAFYNHVWVIGDQEAIDVNQQAEVNELAELAKIGGEE